MLETMLPYIDTLLGSVATFVLIVLGAGAILGIRLLCKKFNIEIDTNTMNSITAVITQVIRYLDQKYVKSIKFSSEDNTLSSYQEAMIKEKSVNMLKVLLSETEKNYLLDKYGKEVEQFDEILDILIESNLNEIRESIHGDYIESIELTDSSLSDETGFEVIENTYTSPTVKDNISNISSVAIPTEFEIVSISVCPANCLKCTLTEDCPYCRCKKDDEME